MPNQGVCTVSRPKRLVATLLVFVLVVSLTPASALVAQEPPPPSAAYIWRTDASAADGYKSLIEAAGYDVTLLTIDEVAAADLAAYSLVVAGPETGYAYDWGTAEAVNALRDAGTPILGLGYGGACLFGQLGLSINWGNGWVGPETSVYASDPTHPVFTTPNVIDVPGSGIVSVYDESDHIGQYAPVLAADAELIGREPVDEEHWTLAAEGRSMLWGFTGSPYDLTPAGEKLFMNAVAYAASLGAPGAGMPDLQVSDIWLEGSTVFYQICNLGDAPAEAGHTTRLYRGDSPFASDVVDVVLAPGARETRSFAPAWAPTAGSTHVWTVADADGLVTESDEDNNEYSETWGLDTRPPRIVSAPTVTSITQTSARVRWAANEPCSGRVRYGTRAGVYSEMEPSAEIGTSHAVTLDGLAAATTYHLVVECIDDAGNTARSRDVTFETKPVADTTDPSISVVTEPTGAWSSLLVVDAQDDTGVKLLKFAVDGVEDAVDYSAPFEYNWDPARFGPGTHMVDITAVDETGNWEKSEMAVEGVSVPDPTRPVTKITSPAYDDTLSGKVTIKASVTDDVGVRSVDLMVDAYMRGHIDYPQPYPKSKTAEFTFDTTQLDNTVPHTIAVLASDGTWRAGYGTELDTVRVWVDNAPPPPPPKLAVVKREVKRFGTYFQVILTVKNTGGEDAMHVKILDPVTSFQPVTAETNAARYKATWPQGASATAQMEIAPKTSIPPGQTRSYNYLCVPFMTADSGVTPMIGNSETTFKFESPTQPGVYTGYDQAVAMKTTGGEPIYVAHASALKSALDLIVTSPENLRDLYGATDADTILATSAELAVERDAALGYLDMPSRFPGRELDSADKLAVGRMHGGSIDEVALGDASAKRIYIARVVETASAPQGQPPGSPAVHSYRWVEYDLTESDVFEPGDGLAVGSFAGAGAADSIVRADASADSLAIYTASGLTKATTGVPFDDGDTLACGDRTGDGKDEIFVFRQSQNQVRVYTVNTAIQPSGLWSVSLLGTFAWELEKRDCIAMGDVFGDANDEIVIGDNDFDKIRVLSGNGTLRTTFAKSIADGDKLAVGRPFAGTASGAAGKAMIAHASKVTGFAVWLNATGTSSYALTNVGYQNGDLFGAGRLTPSALSDSVIVGSIDDNGFELHAAGESGREELRNLIAGDTKGVLAPQVFATGAWSKRLASNWVSSGALTIVGENEIVPSWGNRIFGTVYANMGGNIGDFPLRADMTDYPYASTVGEEIVPELSCGRIIGNSADEICKAMRASIAVARGETGHSFDRSDITLVSGFPAGLGGGAASMDFWSDMRGIDSVLKSQGFTNRGWIHAPNFVVSNADGSVNQAATKASALSTIWGQVVDTDLLVLAGHGNGGGWDVIDSDDLLARNDPFGSADPVVYGAACSTGIYSHANSFANAMLNRGAAVYFGATNWGLGTHRWIHTLYFDTWRTGVTVGKAARDVKRQTAYSTVPAMPGVFVDMPSYVYSDKHAQYYGAIYHVFGDPEFGAEGPVMSAAAAQDAASAAVAADSLEALTGPGTETIDVDIPDYEVTRLADRDELTIPGGQVLSEDQRPEVPIYVVTREIPKGLAITGVRVTERSEPTLHAGLELPPLVDAVNADASDVLPYAPVASAGDSTDPADPSARDWWPNAEPAWRVIEGVESDTLAITLFPVDYSAATKDARFFKQWTLAVDVAESPLSLAAALTDARTYPSGAPVTLNVALEAGAMPPDVVLEASVRDTLGNVVGGFPLRSLAELGPTSTFSAVWNSGTTPPGPYVAEVVLKDAEGQVLDRTTTAFAIGSASVRADSLTATPEHFAPGEMVDLALAVTNEGDLETDGTAMLRVYDRDDVEVAAFQKEIAGLAAGQSRTIEFAWDTSGVEPGVYEARAFVAYGGGRSNEVTVRVPSSTPHADAGPDLVIERDSASGAHVTLDGSGSSNPGGGALGYAWSWSGGAASGVAPTVVLPAGDTVVTLTVSDGALSDSDTALVRVVDTTPPALSISVPTPHEALQDGVMLQADASDWSGVASVEFSVRIANGDAGTPVGLEHLPAVRVAGSAEDGTWAYPFETLALPDGYYLVRARGLDAFGNEAWAQSVPVSIRNWALVEMLPSSQRFQPGRTVPVKFTVCVAPVVDPLCSFVYNEELEIRIYDTSVPSTPQQVSHFGTSSTDYRINQADRFYITNFKTAKKPATYRVEVWRPSSDS